MRSRKLSLESLEERALLYAVTALPWPDTDVSYSIVPDGTSWNTWPGSQNESVWFETLNGLTDAETWQRYVATAFQTWANHSNLNLHQVSDDGAPNGHRLDKQGNIRLGSIDAGTAAGWASSPLGGLGAHVTMRASTGLLKQEYWSRTRFVNVLTHEIGHALGLDHSDVLGTVMGGGSSTFIGLAADDIAGIQALYGLREHDQFDKAASNNHFNSASRLGFDSSLGIDLRADLTSHADVDYYRLTMPDGAESFTVSADARQLSLLAPKVQVFDANNILIAEASGDYGTVATVKLDGLNGGETYTVVVDGATSDEFGMGAYRLAIDAVVTSPVAEPIADRETETTPVDDDVPAVTIEEQPKVTEPSNTSSGDEVEVETPVVSNEPDADEEPSDIVDQSPPFDAGPQDSTPESTPDSSPEPTPSNSEPATETPVSAPDVVPEQSEPTTAPTVDIETPTVVTAPTPVVVEDDPAESPQRVETTTDDDDDPDPVAVQTPLATAPVVNTTDADKRTDTEQPAPVPTNDQREPENSTPTPTVDLEPTEQPSSAPAIEQEKNGHTQSEDPNILPLAEHNDRSDPPVVLPVQAQPDRANQTVSLTTFSRFRGLRRLFLASSSHLPVDIRVHRPAAPIAKQAVQVTPSKSANTGIDDSRADESTIPPKVEKNVAAADPIATIAIDQRQNTAQTILTTQASIQPSQVSSPEPENRDQTPTSEPTILRHPSFEYDSVPSDPPVVSVDSSPPDQSPRGGDSTEIHTLRLFRGFRRLFLASSARLPVDGDEDKRTNRLAGAPVSRTAKAADVVFASVAPRNLTSDASSPSDDMLDILAADWPAAEHESPLFRRLGSARALRSRAA